MFEEIALLFKEYGYAGLFMISFVESFISPILPDFLLIPLALAAPEKAIYYGIVATGGSVLGGFVGYYIGRRFGLPVVRKFVPEKHTEKIRSWVDEYGIWAIVVAALMPIPYKFVCIPAGMFRVNMTVFLLASIVGRGKRFLLEGLLIYYYGAQALDFFENYTNAAILGLMGALVAFWVIYKLIRYVRRRSG